MSWMGFPINEPRYSNVVHHCLPCYCYVLYNFPGFFQSAINYGNDWGLRGFLNSVYFTLILDNLIILNFVS